MKVAIIGAGNIARAHGPAIRAIEGAQIVGVCDTNQLRAESSAAELGAEDFYTDAEVMLIEKRPDVVHVLTPPATHFALSKLAIHHGCNVLVEKPMALSTTDVQEMLDAAAENDVMICAGHNMAFDALTRKVAEMVTDGKVGVLVSVETSFRFDTNRYPAVRADGAQFTHWIYRLNGGPLQDLMPHPASLVFEFLHGFDEVKTISQEGSILPAGWPEEVRVVLKSASASAYISLSLHEKPDTTTLSIYGDKGAIHADYFSGIITVQQTSSMPRAINRLIHGYRTAYQSFVGATGNIFKVLFGKFDKSGGVNHLIESFYDAIRGNGPVPISKEKMLNTVRLIEAVWPKPSPGLVRAQNTVQQVRRNSVVKEATVLVTGASGFIGTHILKKLDDKGMQARAMVRPNSINAGRLIGSSVDVVYADLADANAVARACEGIEMIFHAGASTDGDWESNEQATIKGTRNVLEAAQKQGVKRMVHLSTLAVYELLDKAKNEIVSEGSAYQSKPRKMGPYAYCKIEAEKLVREATVSGDVGIAILRPGMVIGEGGYPFFPHLGFNLGGKLFLTIGKGAVPLPFTYVGNLVDAVYRAATEDAAIGQIYNIVDDARITARQYLDNFIEVAGADARVVNLPFFVPYLAIGGYEIAAAMRILPKGITSRAQLKWKQAPIIYDTSKAKNELNWQPTVSMQEAMERTFRAYAAKYL